VYVVKELNLVKVGAFACCSVKIHVFSVCSLRDDNVITSKPTWKLKHRNSILEYSEYFCQISSKSLLVILSYTVLKLRRFFETQCISSRPSNSLSVFLSNPDLVLSWLNIVRVYKLYLLTDLLTYNGPVHMPLWKCFWNLSSTRFLAPTRVCFKGICLERFNRFCTTHGCA